MRPVGTWRYWWAILAAAALIAAVFLLLVQRPPSAPRLDLASTNLEHTWRPIISIPWVTYGADFGGVPEWQFDRLEQNGVAAVVWFLFGDGRAALTFDPSGYVRGVAPSFWADYHAVLAAAERHRLKVVWVVADFEIGMPVQVERGTQEYGRADLLQDPAKRHSLIKEALAPILKDKTGSGQIAGWILINEPEHLLRTGYVTEDALRSKSRACEHRSCKHDPICRSQVPGLFSVPPLWSGRSTACSVCAGISPWAIKWRRTAAADFYW